MHSGSDSTDTANNARVAVRGFSAWPAAAVQKADQGIPSHPSPRIIIDSNSVEDYERRLQEFLGPRPSALPLVTDPGEPPSQPPQSPPLNTTSSSESLADVRAAAAAAVRERARAALQRVAPPPSPSLGGGRGCSSPGPSSFPPPQHQGQQQPHAAFQGDSAPAPTTAAAVPQPHRNPHPQPHPASPTPVDWRHILQLARASMAEAPSGQAVLTDKFKWVPWVWCGLWVWCRVGTVNCGCLWKAPCPPSPGALRPLLLSLV